MKVLLAVFMILAIAGLWRYNQKLRAETARVAMAREMQKPQPTEGTRRPRSSVASFRNTGPQPAQTPTVTSDVHASRTEAPRQPLAVAASFTCDGRTRCSQMRSCQEATYFLSHCPNTQMDGDNDGVPCERQWCE